MKRITILDDRPTSRTAYARLARTLDDVAEITTFGDPFEALTWLAGNDVALVVVNCRLRKLDGATFVRRLRALPGFRDVPVMVITAHGDRSHRLLALEAGATDFLRSPVDHAEFITRSRTLLRLHEQSLAIRAAGDPGLQPAGAAWPDQAMRSSAAALAQVIDTMPAYISASDPDGRVMFANAMHLGEPDLPVFAAQAVREPAPAFDEEYQMRSRALDTLVFRNGRPLPAFEQEVAGRSGGARRVLLTIKSPLHGVSGTVDGVLTTSLDITGRKELERSLQHVASHDGLTDLPNRLLLQARLSALLERNHGSSRMVALHVLDLDRFKAVNDRLGHLAGDELLRAVSVRLRSCAGPGDIIARIGADEFAVLQGSIARVEEAAILAQHILDSLNQPVVLAGQQVTVGGSIGISLSSAETTGATEMLRHADLAMYQAKDDGGSRLRFFVPDMDRRIERALQLQHELRIALRADELTLHYQPQMNLRTSRVQGVEALLRWNHPIRGLMMPGEFLPVAEESGLMAEIDEWVLRRACREAAAWTRSGFADVRVGVNISPVRISSDRTRAAIAGSLTESGLAPSQLEIELTERDLVADLDGAARALGELRELGVQVAIDDFGVGYSFLGHVKAFPADRIKIDQSFIRGLLTDESDATIVRAMVAMAHGLRLGVVAEGVETVEQLTQLAVEGCDDIQGFYISRPLPLPDLLTRLRDSNAAAP